MSSSSKSNTTIALAVVAGAIIALIAVTAGASFRNQKGQLYSGNHATCKQVTVPWQVSAGKPFAFSLSFENDGGFTWSSYYQVGPYKNGTDDPTNLGIARTSLSAGKGNGGSPLKSFGTDGKIYYNTVPYGGTVKFSFTGIAPLKLGPTTVQFAMLQPGVEWFGNCGVYFTVVK